MAGETHYGGVHSETTRKTSSETVNNSSTLQNDDAFSFTGVANRVYRVVIWGAVTQVDATAGFKCCLTGAQISTIRQSLSYMESSASANPDRWAGYNTSAGTGITAAGGTIGSGSILFEATVVMDGTGGTVNFQWAQQTATAADTILLLNSTMGVDRIL